MKSDSGNGDLAISKMSALLLARMEQAEQAKDRARARLVDVVERNERGDEVSDAEMVEAYQWVRDAGVVPEPMAFFSLVWMFEKMAEDSYTEVWSEEFSPRYDEIIQRYDLESFEALEDLPEGSDAAEEVSEIEKESDATQRRILLSLFRKFGEFEIADLYERNRAEYDRRREEGRLVIHGPMLSIDEMKDLASKIESGSVDEDDGPEGS